MAETLTFVNVPLSVNIGNGGMHWRTKHRKQHQYWAMLTAMQRAKQFPRIPKRSWDYAWVTVFDVKVFNRNDTDNMMARMKWWQDWLKREGYLTDDRHLYYLVQPTQTIARPSKARPDALTDCFTFTIQSIQP